MTEWTKQSNMRQGPPKHRPFRRRDYDGILLVFLIFCAIMFFGRVCP